MSKLPHQQSIPAVDGGDLVTKDYADANYSGGNTLDGAYDQNGAGAGRTITAEDGAVVITSSDADNNNVLEVTKTPAGSQSGLGVLVTMGANTTGAGLSVSQSGTGAAASVSGGAGLQVSPVIHYTSEAATVPGGAPSAGEGKLWVRSDTPNNVLVFTDDAGTDVEIDGVGDPRDADAIITTTGPTTLAIQAIADGDYLLRSGATIIGGTPAGSGGVIRGAEGAYLQAKLDANQTGTFTDDVTPYAFNSLIGSSRGELTVSAGLFSGLKAGRTYYLSGQVRPNTDVHGFQWYDVTNAAFIGNEGAARATSATTQAPGGPHASAIITPETDIEVELRFRGGVGAADVLELGASGPATTAVIIEIGALAANVTGGLEFIDEIEVAGSAVTTITFGSGGNGKFQRALDGDADEEYVIVGELVKAAAATNYTLEPNGITANQRIEQAGGTGTSVSGAASSNLLLAGPGGSFANGTVSSFEVCLRASTGGSSVRRFVGAYACKELGVNDVRSAVIGGGWEDNTTSITTLDITADQAGGIDVGSVVRLYRRRSANLRADHADTYERKATAAIAEGASTTEVTMGHTIYPGSIVGMSVRCEDARTAGSVTCNLKVDGTTVDSLVIDATNTTSTRKVFAIGVNKFIGDKNVSVEFVADSGYLNNGGTATGFTFVVMMQNASLLLEQTLEAGRDQLTVAGNVLEVTGLDGDADGDYTVKFWIKYTGSQTDVLSLRLNNDTGTNYDVFLNTNNATANFTNGQTSMPLSVSTATTHEHVGELKISCIRSFGGTTALRTVKGHIIDHKSGTTKYYNEVACSYLGTGNIESVRLFVATASILDVGSILVVYREPKALK